MICIIYLQKTLNEDYPEKCVKINLHDMCIILYKLLKKPNKF